LALLLAVLRSNARLFAGDVVEVLEVRIDA
jgi:hypothetical protein